MLTVLKISDTHEWRLVGGAWGLHYLPSEDAGVPLRVAARFEAEVLYAAKEAADIREGVVAELVRLKSIKERMEADDGTPIAQQMSRTQYSALRREYEGGKGFAWARARSLIAGVSETDHQTKPPRTPMG